MSAAKKKGTAFESAVVSYLQAEGWPAAERRALNGTKDRGDVAGVAGVCLEVKSAKELRLAAWAKELEAEQRNANAAIGAVWAKRVGKTSAADGYVIMTGAQLVQLLKEAGYQ